MNELQKPPRFDRAAGAAGLGFLACLIAESALRGAPLAASASGAAVIDHYAARGGALAITDVIFAISVPLLLVYVTGLRAHLAAAGRAAEPWATVGAAAAAAMVASFAAVVAADLTTGVLAAELAGQPALARALHVLHNAAFTVNAAVLGTVLGSFGLAWRCLGHRRWLGWVAMAGGGLLIASALAAPVVLRGSALGLLGLAGFLVWMLWLALTSARLLRTR